MSLKLLQQQEKSESISLTTSLPTAANLKRRRLKRKSIYFSKMQHPLELALQEVTISNLASARWIKLCLSYVEFVAPAEATREPARLMRLLSEYPLGLKREELLEHFYQSYQLCSLMHIPLKAVANSNRIRYGFPIESGIRRGYDSAQRFYFIIAVSSSIL